MRKAAGLRRLVAAWAASIAVLFSLVVLFTGPLDGAESAQSLVAVGDMASCSGSSAPNDVSDLLDTLPGDIVGLGDLAYPDGSESDFENCFDPIFGRHKNRFIPVVGNHEYHTSGASGYADYFGDAVGRRGQFYYSEQRGDWQLIVLNSNCSSVGCGDGSAQYSWLETVLASAPSNSCRLVAMHHPRWSSFAPYADQAFLDPMLKLLHEAGTDIVVSGHAHHYERFSPQDAERQLDVESGFHQFIVGTGGVALRSANLTAANSAVRIQSHGALSLDLDVGEFSWRFFDTDENELDSGSDSCVSSGTSTTTTPTPTTAPPTTATPTTVSPATSSPTSASPPPLGPLPADVDDPQLFRLYRAVFLRDPDGGGLAYWTSERGSGRPLAQIAEHFAASPEFIETYGELDNPSFVDRVYQNVLGRSPDLSGFDYWVAQMEQGLQRGELVLRFSESPEFIEKVGG